MIELKLLNGHTVKVREISQTEFDKLSKYGFDHCLAIPGRGLPGSCSNCLTTNHYDLESVLFKVKGKTNE